MNITNLSRGPILQVAVDLVLKALKELIEEGKYINAIITSSSLRKNGSSYVGAKILFRENGDIVEKNVAFTVNSSGYIYAAIPMRALCDG